MYCVYMICDITKKLYIGVSKHPEKRIAEHNTERGSIYTKTGRFQLVFLEEYPTLAQARKREVQLKKWRRSKKEMLIEKYQLGLQTRM